MPNTSGSSVGMSGKLLVSRFLCTGEEQECARIASDFHYRLRAWRKERERARLQISFARVPASATRMREGPRRIKSFEALLSFSGGAGNRTPVREEIDHSFYVRSPLLDVSTRW